MVHGLAPWLRRVAVVRRQMLNLKRLAEGRRDGTSTPAPEPMEAGTEDMVGERSPR